MPRLSTKELMVRASRYSPDRAGMIACMKRELGYRKRVYLRMVNQEEMALDEAAIQIACVQAIIKNLEGELF